MMIDPYPDPSHPLPRPILIGAGALAVATILLAGLASRTGIGAFRTPAEAAVVSRDLLFAEADDGLVRVRDAGGGDEVARLTPDVGGFVRATLRGLSRNRQMHGEAVTAPYRIGLAADGRLWLEDLATRQSIDLRAFGPTNAAAFAAFLRPGDKG